MFKMLPKETYQLCNRYHLDLHKVIDYFKLKAKGLNNQETAKKMKVHRVTVQRYSKAIKTMKKEEFESLWNQICYAYAQRYIDKIKRGATVS